MTIATAVVADLLRPRSWEPEPRSQWMQEARDGQAQVARLMIVIACVIGIPLIAGGLARTAVAASSTVAWVTAAVAVIPGALFLRWLWERWPDRRLDASWWDRQAQIGDGGRRRTIAVLALSLGLVAVYWILIALR